MAQPSAVRVLVVDDYEPFRQSVRSMLSEAPGLQIIGEVLEGGSRSES